MPKKLKTVVKSLYSHEIRKNVSLENLKSLKLEDAWPFIREEIEIEIGNSKLVCVPYITEADLYTISSVFIQNDKETNGKKFTPLGKLYDNINKEKTNANYVKCFEEGKFLDTDYKFPHESVKVRISILLSQRDIGIHPFVYVLVLILFVTLKCLRKNVT